MKLTLSLLLLSFVLTTRLVFLSFCHFVILLLLLLLLTKFTLLSGAQLFLSSRTQESLRLVPPVPSFSRVMVEDITLGEAIKTVVRREGKEGKG